MPKPKKLSKAAIKKIGNAVDGLFGKLKARLLGPRAFPKALHIRYVPELSLQGLYEAAHREERGIPDKEQLHQLLDTAENYLEALRHRTKAQTVTAIQSFLADAEKKGIDTDLKTVLGGQLADLYGSIGSQVRRVIDTESQRIRNVGVVDGIIRSNQVLGIEDPTVFFVVVRDQHLCDECKRIHLLPDGVTPRVWKLSEVKAGYHLKEEDRPAIGGLHPHCRCSMTTLLPGFGFKAGYVSWIKSGHDEYEAQR